MKRVLTLFVTWPVQLGCTPGEDYPAMSTANSTAVLWATLVVFASAAIVVRTLGRRNRIVKRMVTERTAEVVQAQNNLKDVLYAMKATVSAIQG